MRLKPGPTLARIRSEQAAVMAGFARDSPVSASGRVYVARPLVDSIVGDLGPILIIVLSSTALLLAAGVRERDEPDAGAGAARAREAARRPRRQPRPHRPPNC